MADEEIEDKIALVDLDGSTADYDSAMQHRLELLKSPGESDEYHNSIVPEYIKARCNLIRNQPGFWRELLPIAEGLRVVELLRETGFHIKALTKGPTSVPPAWQEKVEWCRRHIPYASVIITEDEKSMVYGRVLFDDFPPYFLPWLRVRPRGLVICLAQPWNVGINHPNVVRYDGTNFDLIRDVVQSAYDRAPGKS
jgi:5'(3')-deoxyribonucleotidase